MIVVFTVAALDDLEGIGDYISRDNPERAASFVAEIEAKCLELADLPKSFQLVERHEKRGIRRRRHRKYLIFYRPAKNRIVIQRVLHASRNHDALL